MPKNDDFDKAMIDIFCCLPSESVNPATKAILLARVKRAHGQIKAGKFFAAVFYRFSQGAMVVSLGMLMLFLPMVLEFEPNTANPTISNAMTNGSSNTINTTEYASSGMIEGATAVNYVSYP